MTSLIEHARKELVFLGESDRTISAYIDVLQSFSDMSSLGLSPEDIVPVITKLLYFKNLTPLTDDPSEWAEVGTNSGMTKSLWQSTRDAQAFSTDAGKTYYILSERDVDPNSIHTSEPSTNG